MKKIILYLFLALSLSCSNRISEANKEALDELHTVKEYSTVTLVKEKFLEFYDLSILLENSPQFEENIKKRMRYFMLDANKVISVKKNSKIKNLKVVKNTSKMNMKLLFDLKTGNLSKKDSVFVTIIKEDIILDSSKVSSTKVKFSRFN